MIKNIPNMLSFLRVLLSILLLFIYPSLILFTVCYFICGISDLADGYIARRFHCVTEMGATLDSIGDFVFWTVIFYLFLFRSNIHFNKYLIIFAVISFLIKLINMLISYIRFRKVGLLHTIGNKLAGLVQFLALPVCIILHRVPFTIGFLMCLVALYSSIDECAILLILKEYDANRKGFLIP